MEKNYDHNSVEDHLYASWEKSGKMRADNTSKKKPFTIPLPPPNVTGQLHLGHAAMLAIEDILIRYKKMTNHEVCWLPGTDHAAIATENVVLKHLGKKSREEFTRDEFWAECKSFADEKHDRIVTQMKKMGAWLDWSRESYTLDEPRSLAVTSIFKMLYEDGLIERGYRMINWSMGAQSVISDDELEWDTIKEPFYYIRCGEFVVGTVRPETKCADSPVVLHPTSEYIRTKFTDSNGNSEILILGKHCFEAQTERDKVCNLLDKDGEFEILETLTGNDLVGKEFEAETFGGIRKFFVLTDEIIDPEKGTGAMTISANHSADDHDLVNRLNLKNYFIEKIDFEGKMSSLAGECAGMDVLKARKFSGKLMKDKGLLTGIDAGYEHRVPKCYRSGCVIEPMVSPQWFVLVDKEFTDRHTGERTTLKKMTQEAVREKQVKIIPERFEKTYFQWIDNLRDWCISRQIWWGHRIPVWYDDEQNIHLPEEKKVIFVRHGESEESSMGDIIQTQEASLSSKGKTQAQEVIQKISGKNITKIISSSSIRALETAQIIAKELGIEVEVYDEFKGLEFGSLHGKKRSDVYDKKVNTALEIAEQMTEGEDRHQAFDRIQKGWGKIKQIQTDGNILLVSHRTILSGLDGFLHGEDSDCMIKRRLQNDERPAGGVWGEKIIFTQPKIPGKKLRQDEDTLDTWFSSALWPISPLGWPNENPDFDKFYPSDVLETGHDIIFFWVARMLMFGRYATGKYPFHAVYLHGLVCDEHGKKMSKSKGNGIDPLEVIEEVGADAVRLSLVVGSSPGNNIPIGKNKIKAYRNFVNKLWNAGRFVQMQMEGVEKSQEKIIPQTENCALPPLTRGARGDLIPKSIVERWILSRFSTISQEISGHLEKFEISAAGDKMYHFVWDEFCAWFLEAQKVNKNPVFLAAIFRDVLKLVHPICPFVTEQLWKDLYGETEFLLEEAYPNSEYKDEKAEQYFGIVQNIITDIRRVRTEQKINPKEKIPGIFVGELHEEKHALIKELAGLSELSVVEKIPVNLEHAVEINGKGYALFIEIPFDEEAEKIRLQKEKESLVQKIAMLEGRLSNKKYVENAPEKLVADTKAQLEEAKELLGKLL